MANRLSALLTEKVARKARRAWGSQSAPTTLLHSDLHARNYGATIYASAGARTDTPLDDIIVCVMRRCGFTQLGETMIDAGHESEGVAMREQLEAMMARRYTTSVWLTTGETHTRWDASFDSAACGYRDAVERGSGGGRVG
jgi:hypothetical protein